MTWLDDAACKGATAIFFAEGQCHNLRAARAICAECPVVAECREAGLHERHGVRISPTRRQQPLSLSPDQGRMGPAIRQAAAHTAPLTGRQAPPYRGAAADGPRLAPRSRHQAPGGRFGRMIWLVIACPQAHVPRLAHCLGSLQHDPACTVVVDAACHDRITDDLDTLRVTDGSHDFSLARLWNHGLRWAYDAGATEVAVLSSDVVGHPDSLNTLASCLRGNALTMAGPSDRSRILDGTRTTHDRVPGGCFMVAAEHRLFCDEAYRWWYSDDDLEMQARALGPVGVFAGTGLQFSVPDSTLTSERQGWAIEDRAYFVKKWGCEPW